MLLGPRVLARAEAQTGQRFVEQPRHLDIVGDDETLAPRADQQAAAAALAAAVDLVRSAAGEPRKVRLRVDQNPAEPARGGEAGEAIDFLVDLEHGVPSCLVARRGAMRWRLLSASRTPFSNGGLRRERPSSSFMQDERDETAAGRGDHVLLAIELVGNRAIRHTAHPGIPQRNSRGRVVGADARRG